MAASILRAPSPLRLLAGWNTNSRKTAAPIGLYDIKNAGQEQGLWVGYGSWKAMPSAKPAAPKPIVDDGFDPNDDKPVLHRKHADAGGKSDSARLGSGSRSGPARHCTKDLQGRRQIRSSSRCSSRSGPSNHPQTDTACKQTPTDPVLHKHDNAGNE